MTTVIIPARLESQRLPGKLLMNVCGKPVIWYTWQAARHAFPDATVAIASDSDQILGSVAAFGADVVETGSARNGTERVALAARTMRLELDDLVINLQADEPGIWPEYLSTLEDLHRQVSLISSPNMVTMACPAVPKDFEDRNAVKVRFSEDRRAQVFTRSNLPGAWRHIGVYGYRFRFLERYISLPESASEKAESLEQNRALDKGFPVYVAPSPPCPHGIDTIDDYYEFLQGVVIHG